MKTTVILQTTDPDTYRLVDPLLVAEQHQLDEEVVGRLSGERGDLLEPGVARLAVTCGAGLRLRLAGGGVSGARGAREEKSCRGRRDREEWNVIHRKTREPAAAAGSPRGHFL